MRYKYTKQFRNQVVARMATEKSNNKLSKEFGIPLGTIAQWRFNYSKRSGRKSVSEHRPALDTKDYVIGWLIEAETKMIKQSKKDRLVSYLIGVVVGMAIGSLVMRAIQ